MDKCYCIHCGVENKKKSIKCKACHKLLRPVDELVLDLVKDKFVDESKESITNFIINFIKTHIYGIVLTITIITSVVASSVVDDIPSDKVVSERPVVINKINYSDYEGVMKDTLVALTSNQGIDKYRYGTYYKVNESKIDDHLSEFMNDLDKVKSSNKRYYLLFNLQVYTEDMVHYTKIEQFMDKYKDEVLANEFYNLHNDMYALAISDEAIYPYVEDVKNLYVTICECKDDACTPNPFLDDLIEGTKTFYHFTFLKRDGSWYLLKLASEEVATMPDSSFLGAVYNGNYQRFSYEDFEP